MNINIEYLKDNIKNAKLRIQYYETLREWIIFNITPNEEIEQEEVYISHMKEMIKDIKNGF
jgi:hypothetical protein|tara:strand:+ start:36 stop:218 length:183 start_codon:yes stop_codon:yes gene_type:complete